MAKLATVNAGVAESDGTLPTLTHMLPTACLRTIRLNRCRTSMQQSKRVYGGSTVVVVPLGVEVSVPGYSTWRDPRVLGPDDEEKWPERWLKDGGGAMKKRMLTFGSGPSAYIGKNLYC
ncbi:hypothetical protein BKA62DRAFT_790622 [Auriculariales sp. MPI-PUGE-AT-0066]|nr:hypothetical protein BKA62DRAFT_790622 [Auriculariales sp. MPI-PUGE-AT-0066]